MHAREASVLEFDYPGVCRGSAKDVFLRDHVQQGLQFFMEHACYQVRTVSGGLPRAKIGLDFGPLWIGCHSYEEVRASFGCYQSHRIQVELM